MEASGQLHAPAAQPRRYTDGGIQAHNRIQFLFWFFLLLENFYILISFSFNRLCGLVFRVPDYTSRGSD
jgi:hypothetical protein